MNVLCADGMGHAGALVHVLDPAAPIEALPVLRPPHPNKRIKAQSADREKAIIVFLMMNPNRAVVA